MEKKYIPFNKSMASDKRNPDFAYLLNDVLDTDGRGFYPSAGYKTLNPNGGFPAGSVVVGIIDQFKIVANSGESDIYRNNDPISAPVLKYTIAESYDDAAIGNDGVHALFNGGKVFRLDSSSATEVADFGAGVERKVLFDGAEYFYFHDQKIYRQLKDTPPVQVFDNTEDHVEFAAVNRDDIWWTTRDGDRAFVYKWGKGNSTIVDKRIVLENTRILGFGTIDNELILVHSVGMRQNKKEKFGKLIISKFDGDGFVEVNSIKTGDPTIFPVAQSLGNKIMLLAVSGNENLFNPDLYQNHVYKIYKDGSIQTVFDTSLLPEDVSSIASLSVQYDYFYIGSHGNLYHNLDLSADDKYTYTDFTGSTYITNLLDFTVERHKFGGIGFSFEKLFDQTGQLDIYYRTSEREDWILIDNINVEKIKNNTDNRRAQTDKDAKYASDTIALDSQVYELTKMPDGTPFKEFHEIQFKLESLNGFSVIDFWYYSEPTKRITRG